MYQAPPPQASYIQPPPVQPTYTPSPVLYQPVPAPQQQQATYQMTPAQAGPYGGVNGVGVGRVRLGIISHSSSSWRLFSSSTSGSCNLSSSNCTLSNRYNSLNSSNYNLSSSKDKELISHTSRSSLGIEILAQ